ncbi:hypothetical protein Fmac_017114 [Flemingia macrophylla]|uniref:Protein DETOXIFICATION n=1 Tax=Flemingia macrophylla TaxID=520843 RepID=A0ABD1M169_9FABA
MEEGSEGGKWGWKKVRRGMGEEMKKVGTIAAPMVVASVLQYLIQVVSMVMVGHLGQLSLSSVAIATSITNVSGFSVLTQSLVSPIMLTSAFVLCLHVVMCWSLVFKLGLGHVGAAISFSVCVLLNVIVLLSFVRYSSACNKTRVPFSNNALLHVGQFFRFAVPAAVMVCLKWWACEILVLLAGVFRNPTLETSVLSICLTISTLHFTIPYGFGAAASTRVSNELGAGKPEAVRVAVSASMLLALAEGLIVSATLLGCRHFLGYAYSNDSEVVHYVAVLTPLLCLSIFTDSLQAVLSGVARGSGWQHLGAYVNLGAFYLVGIPVGCVLGFVAHFRAKGLWIGIVAGSIVQSIFLSLITALTNWNKQAKMARERIFDAKPRDENGSTKFWSDLCCGVHVFVVDLFEFRICVVCDKMERNTLYHLSLRIQRNTHHGAMFRWLGSETEQNRFRSKELCRGRWGGGEFIGTTFAEDGAKYIISSFAEDPAKHPSWGHVSLARQRNTAEHVSLKSERNLFCSVSLPSQRNMAP